VQTYRSAREFFKYSCGFLSADGFAPKENEKPSIISWALCPVSNPVNGRRREKEDSAYTGSFAGATVGGGVLPVFLYNRGSVDMVHLARLSRQYDIQKQHHVKSVKKIL